MKALINGIGKTDRWEAWAWYSRRTAWGTSVVQLILVYPRL